MNILHVVGARPNFIKVAPVMRALQGRCSQMLVHTGQHYDRNMSEVFFRQLSLPRPDVNLEVGPAGHALQTARIMTRFDDLVQRTKPERVLVYGDVNSTLAAALVCSKRSIPVAHVEAGLRSFDNSMPEEINRVLTDRLADMLFTPSADGNDNLKREGIAGKGIHLVGNVMIDTLVRLLPKARLPINCASGETYGLVTLHRPANVDDPIMLQRIWDRLLNLAQCLPLIFPLHPRTRGRLHAMGLLNTPYPGLTLLEPQGYLTFLALQRDARLVITDSGGVQEETTFLGVPCLTLRPNTERPITLTQGTNTLVGHDLVRLQREVEGILAGRVKSGTSPPLWDGQAGGRIAAILCQQKV